MRFVICLFFISLSSFAQLTFKADSTEFVVFKGFQDSLQNELKKDENQAFLKEFSQKFEKYYDKEYQYKRFETLSIDALEMDLYDLRNAQRKSLENANISAFLKEYLKNENEIQYWHLLYAYPIIKANAETKSRRVTSISDVILKGFKKELLTNNQALKSQAFRNFLPQYVNYENSRINNFEKYTNLLKAVNDKSEFTLNNFKGLISDYSLAHILKTHKKYLSTSLASNILSQIDNQDLANHFTGTFLDDVIKQTVQAELAKKEAEKKSKTDLEFVDLKDKTFDLSKYKGKVIYLDFWASWCGPCKVQFPHAKKLKNELPAKLKKDIVFLYISIDDTKELWKEGIKVNDLEGFENGFTEGAWNSPVLQKLGVRSIPRYMLIDKTGKIVDNNAKRPNNPEILNELIKLAE